MRFWRQRKATAVNLSFSAFIWRPLRQQINWKDTSLILYNVTNMEYSSNNQHKPKFLFWSDLFVAAAVLIFLLAN